MNGPVASVREEDGQEALVWRARLVAVCVALAAVAFRQRPGLVASDTKLDLTTSPWDFLGKALHLWDPQGAFGQLQNQAYGYLFPMGPFHGVLTSAGVAPWVVQRLWWSTLLCVAFLGVWRLATELRVGSPWLRLLGAVAFALSPRIASELTVTSVEVWPMAVAPWVLLPLVVRADHSWRWRITRSALAFAACGGVNAVASGAALVLPALWFLTRRPSVRVVLAFAGWLGAVVAAMVWWLVPLLVLGRHSPPFLDWIEGSAVTTSTASIFESLRGTSAWLSFLTTPSGPEWPGGWAYVTEPGAIVATVLLAGLGLAGLALRRTPERVFLTTAVLVGMVLLGLGHASALGTPWSAQLRELLDGSLAALRNTHKFDLVVRVPLTLGLISGVSAGWEALRRVGVKTWVPVVTTVSLLVMMAAPSVVAGLARDDSYTAIPSYWHETANWLDAQPDAGSVLELPAASFAEFTWGSTRDDPLQALMSRPFAVRDAVPLGSAGATRWLDGMERQLGSGRGDAGVGQALATAGVRFVVLRNDLRMDSRGDPLVAIRAGLDQSGLEQVATFGPVSAPSTESETESVDFRTSLPRPSVEIYRVPGATTASMQPLSDVPSVAAGPEDASAVAQQVGVRLGLYGSDAAAAAHGRSGADVVTDGLRRREVNFGQPTHNTSQVLTAAEPPRQDRLVTDFDSDPSAPRTTTTWAGIAGVSASSSASDANATLRLGPSTGPAAALDGDASTRWVSGTFGRAVGEWLQVEMDGARRVGGVRLDVSVDRPIAARPAELVVSTEAGSRRASVGKDGGNLFVGLPDGPTRWVRVTLEKVGSGPPNGFSLTELKLTGVTAQQRLRLPAAQAPTQIVMHADDGGRAACLAVSSTSYCAPSLAVDPEWPAMLTREVRLGAASDYQLAGTVVPVSSARTDDLFELGDRIGATASSRLVDSPIDRPGAALDRDTGTGWIAGQNDFGPTFTVTLPEGRTISGLQFQRDPSLAASGAKAVSVSFDGGKDVLGEVDDAGYLRFTPRKARSLSLTFGATRPLVNVDSRSGARTFVPVGFSELRVFGAEDLRRPLNLDAETGVPCGFGPVLTVNGTEHPTQVEGTLADLARGRPLAWSVCSPDRASSSTGTQRVRLRASNNLVRAVASGEFAPESLTLTASSSTTRETSTPVPRALSVARHDPVHLSVDVPARDSEELVTVAQNYNPGWTATAEGRELHPVRVNGWMQGWLVPAGSAVTISGTFTPDGGYRAGLATGGVLLALLGLSALLSGRHDRGRRAGGGSAPMAKHRERVGGSAATLPRWVGVAVLLVAGWLLGGPLGLALALVVVPVGLVRGRLLRPVVLVGVIGLPLTGGLLVAIDTWPQSRANLDSALVQALSLGSLLLGSGLALLSTGRARRRGRRVARDAPGDARPA